MKNEYSSELIAEIKRLYPHDQALHKAAENHMYGIGRILDDRSNTNFSINVILEANSLEELKAQARNSKERVDLYIKWFQETKQWNK